MGTVLKSSLLNLAATLVSLTAGFAVSILNARLLGPEGSGLAAFALWFAASLSSLADRGTPQVLLRSLGAPENETEADWRAIARAAFSLFIRPVLAAALATLAYAIWVAHGKGAERGLFWMATLALFLLYAFSAFSTAAARGRGNFRETALSTVTGSVLQLPFIVAGALFFGAAGAVAGMALRFAPQVLRLGRYVSFSTRPQPARLTPDMRRYARQMWLSDTIDVVVMTRVELALLGLFFSPADMGYFAAAAVFSGLVGQFALQLSPALIVGFSAAEGSGGARARLFADAMRFTALGVFPVAFGGAAIIGELLPLVFGEAFAASGTAAALLLVSSAVTGIAVVPWAYLAATGGSASLVRIMVASALLTVALLTAAIWLAGLNGAALARTVAELLTLAMLAAAIRSRSGLTLPLRLLMKTALAAAVCGLAAHAVAETLSGWAGVAAGIAAGAVVYPAALRVFGLVSQADAAALINSGPVRRLPRRLGAALVALLRAVATGG